MQKFFDWFEHIQKRSLELLDQSKQSISKKILAVILIISSAVTTVTTIIQLSFDYFQDVSTIRNNLGLVETSYVQSIASSAWNIDMHQLQSQLDGIISIPGIIHAEFVDERKTVLVSAGRPIGSDGLSRAYKISHSGGGQEVFLGELVVSADLGEVYAKIWRKALLIFVVQFGKTLLVSALIYLAIQKLLTNHLVHISQYLRKLELGGNEGALQLRRTRYRKHQDELEVLVSSINQMRSKIELSYSQVNAMNEDLENKVQQKTQLILEQRQQLEYAAKMAALGEMAGGMAHEINTPLATSQIHVQIISRKQEEGQLTPETLGPSLEGLKRALDRIAIVVQGLRFFSKDGAQDSMTLNDLSSIVEKSIGLFREKIANLGIRLKVEGPSVEVFCRPEDISKVLLSLLFNARDAVANCPDKWIHVEWSFENDRICLSVTDSGPGIPPENRDKIFQPFFTTKDLNMGTGLGLSIAKGLVESQQGELELDLNSRQTKFVIRLHTPYSLKVA